MNKKGSILILAMLVIVVLIVFGAVLVSRGTSERVLVQQHDEYAQALWLADAGVHRTIAALKNDDWTGGWTNDPPVGGVSNFGPQILGNGTYEIAATNLTIDNPTLTSTGTVGNLNRIIDVTLQREFSQPFQGAAYAVGDLNVSGNVVINSFPLGNNGDIGGNGDITVSGNAEVQGDASSAGGTITEIGAADITGTIDTTTPEQFFPPIVIPIGFGVAMPPGTTANDLCPPVPGPPCNLDGTAAPVFIRFGDFTVENTETLTIDGDVVLWTSTDSGTGQLDILGLVTLNLGATLRIYTNGIANIQAGALVNTTGQAVNLQLYSTMDGIGTPGAGQFDVIGNGAFIGIIYAPNARVNITGGGTVQGAVIGGDVTISNNISFDESLANFEPPLPPTYVVSEWSERINPY